MTTQQSKSIPEISVDTQLIVKRLKKAAVGEVVTYKELSLIIGGNVQANKRPLLQSARNYILRDDRIVFECVENEGLKRLSDSEIVETAPTHTLARIRRAAKRGARKLGCAEYEKLSRDEQIKFNMGASMLGAIAQLSKPASLKLIEPRIADAQDRLSFAKTLELFSK